MFRNEPASGVGVGDADSLPRRACPGRGHIYFPKGVERDSLLSLQASRLSPRGEEMDTPSPRIGAREPEGGAGHRPRAACPYSSFMEGAPGVLYRARVRIGGSVV